ARARDARAPPRTPPRGQLRRRRIGRAGRRARSRGRRGDPAMSTALHALAVALPCGYLLCALLYAAVFVEPRRPVLAGLRRSTLALTLLGHVAWFLLRREALGHFPVSDVWSTLSAVALCTAALHAAISRAPTRAGTGGVV